jgi:hypothetical protein
MAKITYRQEYIRCGKGCKGCPHGPYWYSYERIAGKLKKRYIGKNAPSSADQNNDKAAPHPWEPILRRSTATEKLAREILSLRSGASKSDMQSAFKKATMKYHPDRGGSTIEMQCVVAAHTYLKSLGKPLY